MPLTSGKVAYITMWHMTQSRPLLTVYDVAERARVTPRTVWRWEKEGRISAVRIGRTVRFRAEDVETLLELDEAAGE